MAFWMIPGIFGFVALALTRMQLGDGLLFGQLKPKYDSDKRHFGMRKRRKYARNPLGFVVHHSSNPLLESVLFPCVALARQGPF